jgi:hypothetical protein
MFSPNSGKSITAGSFLGDVRQYLVENGPLAMRGYREAEFKVLEEAGPGVIEMFADLSQISRCHDPTPMAALDDYDQRMQVIDDSLREAEECRTERASLTLPECVTSFTAEGLVRAPWTLFDAIQSTSANPDALIRHIFKRARLDYRTFLALRPGLLGFDRGFQEALNAQRRMIADPKIAVQRALRTDGGDLKGVPKAFADFLSDSQMVVHLGDGSARLVTGWRRTRTHSGKQRHCAACFSNCGKGSPYPCERSRRSRSSPSRHAF